MARKPNGKELEILLELEEPKPLFNEHFFMKPFAAAVETKSFAKEFLLEPQLFFDDEFKQGVLRYVPSVIPSISGGVHAADFAKEMTPSEAYARTAGNLFTPAQFIAMLFAFLIRDYRTKKSELRILRDDHGALNLFCVRARGRLVSVWVDMNFSNDEFTGVGVFGFHDIKSMLEDDGFSRLANARLFV